jgi:hypothetical protein
LSYSSLPSPPPASSYSSSLHSSLYWPTQSCIWVIERKSTPINLFDMRLDSNESQSGYDENQTPTHKVKLSLSQAVEAHSGLRRRCSQIFQAIGSHMAVTMSHLSAGRPLHPRKFAHTHYYLHLQGQ